MRNSQLTNICIMTKGEAAARRYLSSKKLTPQKLKPIRVIGDDPVATMALLKAINKNKHKVN